MKKNQWSKARTFTPEELAAPLIAIWDATTSIDGFTKDHLEGLGVKYKLKSGNSAHEKMKKDSRNCISNTNRGLAESRGGIIYTLVQESFRPMKEKRKGNAAPKAAAGAILVAFTATDRSINCTGVPRTTWWNSTHFDYLEEKIKKNFRTYTANSNTVEATAILEQCREAFWIYKQYVEVLYPRIKAKMQPDDSSEDEE